MNRKRLFVVIGIAVILSVGAYALSRNIQQKGAGTDNPVTITDIKPYLGDLGTTTVSSIEQTTYARIKQSTSQPNAHYDASVRNGSYFKKFNAYEGVTPAIKVPTVEFLLDIPDARRTYKIRYSGGQGYPYGILYVLCPTSSQNAFGPFDCTDQE